MNKFLVDEKEFRNVCGEMIFSKNTVNTLYYQNGELSKFKGKYIYVLYKRDVKLTDFYVKFDAIITKIDNIFMKIVKNSLYFILGITLFFFILNLSVPIWLNLYL